MTDISLLRDKLERFILVPDARFHICIYNTNDEWIATVEEASGWEVWCSAPEQLYHDAAWKAANGLDITKETLAEMRKEYEERR